MLTRNSPEIGCWYENVEQGNLFEVVSFDEDEHSLAIQYFDGEIEEVDLESFLHMPLRTVDQPEDWSGPFDVEREDRFESDFDENQPEPNELLNYDNEDNLHIVDEF